MSVKPARLAFTAGLGLVIALVAAPLAGIASPVATRAPASSINVAVVVPLSVPGGREGFIDAATLESYTRAGGLLSRELDAVIGSPVALGIDPMLIASIRLLGAEAPQSAIAWLERLRTADNETFALTYADSDLTVGLQAGSTTPLSPTSFGFAIDPNVFAPDVDPAPDPGQTPSPEVPPALPTSTSLVEWAYSLDAIAWPQPSTTTTGDLDKLAASDYRASILNSENISRAPAGRAHLTVADSSVIVTDDTLSALTSTTINSLSASEWQASFAKLAATISREGARSGASAGSVVIALGRSDFTTSTRLRATLTALGTLPVVKPTTIASILAEKAAPATLAERPHTDVRLGLVKSMLRAETSDIAFATVAEDPALITGERRIRMLAALAPQWNRYPGGWGNEISGFLADSARLHRSVRLADSSDLIFGDRGSLPIYVTNELSQPVTVFITIIPRTPLLTVEDSRYELVIEPTSQRRAAVPAVARSNGLVNLDITLRTRTGYQLGVTNTVTTNVQAGWETPFTIGIGVLVFGVFGFGIFRTIKRRRQGSAGEE
ncbi:MAG: DUF6049 family protein [Microbacteriaceae bacterium]